MASSAFERRAAPRFRVDCLGELAAVSAVVSVRVSDISTTGCGAEILGPFDERWADFKGSGVLLLPPRRGAEPSVVLPVSMPYWRTRAKQTRLGLQFQMLSLHQARSLLEIIDSLIEDDSNPRLSDRALPTIGLV